MNFRKIKFLTVAALCAAAFQPAPVFACAACYGASDSPMAQGMNWGIFSLLAVVTVVLGSVATFFVFIGKRSAAAASMPEPDSSAKTEPTQKA